MAGGRAAGLGTVETHARTRNWSAPRPPQVHLRAHAADPAPTRASPRTRGRAACAGGPDRGDGARRAGEEPCSPACPTGRHDHHRPHHRRRRRSRSARRCQDHAHRLHRRLPRHGVPARYVSGYFHAPAPTTSPATPGPTSASTCRRALAQRRRHAPLPHRRAPRAPGRRPRLRCLPAHPRRARGRRPEPMRRGIDIAAPPRPSGETAVSSLEP